MGALGSRQLGPLLLLLLFFSGTALAHKPEFSYIWLQVNEDSLLGRIEAKATDLSAVTGMTLDPKNGLSDAQQQTLRSYMAEHFAVGDETGEFEITFGEFGFLEELEQYVVMYYTLAAPLPPPEDLVIRYSAIMHADPDHRGGFHFENNYRTGMVDNHDKLAYIHAPGRETATLSLLGEDRVRQFVTFLREGVYHIWIGIDHVLFLVTLLLTAVLLREGQRWVPEPQFKSAVWNVVGLVTLFTLAHSITLAMAIKEWIVLPSRLVESIIALSILVVVLDNFFGFLGRYKWSTVFLFGLFHGLGFATVLGELAFGFESRAIALVGFNIGVEIGQLVIVLAVFPLLFWLRGRNYQNLVLRPVSLVVGLLALWWFIERAFDLPATWSSF